MFDERTHSIASNNKFNDLKPWLSYNNEIYITILKKQSRPGVFYKTGVAKILQDSQACTFVKKETLAHASYKFCKIFKNTLFTEHLRVTALSLSRQKNKWLCFHKSG